MSTRNEALRSVEVRTIFAVIAAAFFPHSGSALRRLAISSKNALVKYCTTDAALAARKSPYGKKARMVRPARDREPKGFTGRGLCAAARGSQARSKARDSRSLPAGVPRFESWPTHRQLAPTCGRVRADRGCVSVRSFSLFTVDC